MGHFERFASSCCWNHKRFARRCCVSIFVVLLHNNDTSLKVPFIWLSEVQLHEGILVVEGWSTLDIIVYLNEFPWNYCIFHWCIWCCIYFLKREYKVYNIVIMKRGCRALALHSRGTWFDPLHFHIFPYYFSIFSLRFNLMRYEHLYPLKLRFRNNWQQ